MRSDELIDLLECFEPEDLSECALYRYALEKIKELFDKLKEIVEKSYNDIDYFNNDIRADLENLLKESKL